MKISKTLIGTAGEYYVCAELCRRNILALITPKNNPLFDIVASDPESKRIISIQVKTMSIENEQGWRLGMDLTKSKDNPNLYVVPVNMKADGMNDYFIYEYNALSERINQIYSEYISTPKKDGTARKDIDFRWFDHKFMNDSDRSRLNDWSILGFHLS